MCDPSRSVDERLANEDVIEFPLALNPELAIATTTQSVRRARRPGICELCHYAEWLTGVRKQF